MAEASDRDRDHVTFIWSCTEKFVKPWSGLCRMFSEKGILSTGYLVLTWYPEMSSGEIRVCPSLSLPLKPATCSSELLQLYSLLSEICLVPVARIRMAFLFIAKSLGSRVPSHSLRVTNLR